MKENVKKLLSLLLCLAMAIGLLPMAALAAEPAATPVNAAYVLNGKYDASGKNVDICYHYSNKNSSVVYILPDDQQRKITIYHEVDGSYPWTISTQQSGSFSLKNTESEAHSNTLIINASAAVGDEAEVKSTYGTGKDSVTEQVTIRVVSPAKFAALLLNDDSYDVYFTALKSGETLPETLVGPCSKNFWFTQNTIIGYCITGNAKTITDLLHSSKDYIIADASNTNYTVNANTTNGTIIGIGDATGAKVKSAVKNLDFDQLLSKYCAKYNFNNADYTLIPYVVKLELGGSHPGWHVDCQVVKKTVHTIKWVNYDGTVLQTVSVKDGETTPNYTGSDPTRDTDAQYTYTFAGWNKTPGTMTSTDAAEITITAQYDTAVNQYTVTWKNNDTTLATNQVSYGVTPSYTGETPTKAADAQYTYTFTGWTPEVTSVTGDATYTATFSQNAVEHNIMLDANDGSFENDETTKTVPTTNDKYDFANAPAVKHADSNDKAVAIIGWSTTKTDSILGKDDTVPVLLTNDSEFNEDSTVYAVWGYDTDRDGIPDVYETKHTLTITYATPEGVTAPEAYTEQLINGETYSVTSPAVSGYTANRSVVSGTMGEADVTVTVDYTLTPPVVTYHNVTFTDPENPDNTTFSTASVADGAYAAEPTTAPFHNGFVFTGWSPAVAKTPITSDTEFTAQYAADNHGGTDNTDNKYPGDGIADNDQYALTFNANGGKIGTEDTKTVYTNAAKTYDPSAITAAHDSATLYGKTVPVKFLGWTTDTNANGKLYAAGDTLPATVDEATKYTADTTLYAVWGYNANNNDSADVTEKDKTHTLTINYNKPTGTDTTTLTLVEGQEYSVTSPSVEGYTAAPATVAGTMGTTNNTVNVTYTKNSSGGGTSGGGTSGGGTSGGGTSGGGSTGGGTTIDEPSTPLSSTPTLNKADHFGYIVGYADGTVNPNGNITRAEVATIFYRLLSDESRKAYFKQTNSFSDVSSGDWFNNAVSTLSNAGVITGYTDGSFKPNGQITRAEFATIATRFYDAATKTYDSDPYTDVATSWARQYIDHAAELGIIHGYDDGTFKPDNNITRAEAITLVNNVLGRTPDKDHLLADMKTWSDNANTGAWYYAAIQEATNSHDFTKGESDSYETWTKITAAKDWTALETEWSKG